MCKTNVTSPCETSDGTTCLTKEKLFKSSFVNIHVIDILYHHLNVKFIAPFAYQFRINVF